MKRWFTVALMTGLLVGTVGGTTTTGQDLTTILSKFLQDLWAGSVGVYQPITNIKLANGGALRTGTTANDTLLLQAYDVDGAAYVTLLTLTAGNEPSIVFPGVVGMQGLNLGSTSNGVQMTYAAGLGSIIGIDSNGSDYNDIEIRSFNAGSGLRIYAARGMTVFENTTFGSVAGTGTANVYAGTYYSGTTAGVDCTNATQVDSVKGLVTSCSAPIPNPLTQDEINQLRGLISQVGGKQ